ncbi:MAG: hypothetical protein ACRCYQ_10545 [Nocardioides sp.]
MTTRPHLSPASLRRPHRRRTAAGAGTLAAGLLLGSLAGCGFTNATERDYTPANGANANDVGTGMAVLGAVIVSSEPGSGTFIASFANKTADRSIRLESLAGGDSAEQVTAAKLKQIKLPPGGYLDLSDSGGIKVTGEFEAGQVASVTLGFSSGESIEQNVPVVEETGQWEGLDE